MRLAVLFLANNQLVVELMTMGVVLFELRVFAGIQISIQNSDMKN